MSKVAQVAGVLWRYLQIKASYREVHAEVKSLLPDDLEYHIWQGCPAFDGIVVNASAIQPIIADEWDPDLLNAIIYERGTVPELNADELEQARKFVLYGGGASPSPLTGQSVDPVQD
jgi:hypothetical protein